MDAIRTTTARRSDDGASAVEYALLVTGIAAVIVAVVFLFGGMIEGIFTNTCTSVHTTAAGSGHAIAGSCS